MKITFGKMYGKYLGFIISWWSRLPSSRIGQYVPGDITSTWEHMSQEILQVHGEICPRGYYKYMGTYVPELKKEIKGKNQRTIKAP